MRRLFLGLAAALVMMPMTQAMAAGQQDFKLINRTGQQVDYVYVGPSSSNTWGRDILGRDNVLPSGRSYNITFRPETETCKWDIRLEFEGGKTAETFNVDLCTVSEVIATSGRSGVVSFTFD